MREFQDDEGRTWVATIGERPGENYKGRYFLVLRPRAGSEPEVEVEDVRWNSPRTAERTLETMSLVELKRKLHVALGRAGAQSLP
ncbi:MAG: hypothetical protein R3E10_18925 [Gemmatimonadota bacterium]